MEQDLASLGLWCSLSFPLESLACRDSRVVIWCNLKLSTAYTGSGASLEVQGQPLLVPCLGPPVRSYRVIYR